jgi:hypothetical protein
MDIIGSWGTRRLYSISNYPAHCTAWAVGSRHICLLCCTELSPPIRGSARSSDPGFTWARSFERRVAWCTSPPMETVSSNPAAGVFKSRYAARRYPAKSTWLAGAAKWTSVDRHQRQWMICNQRATNTAAKLVDSKEIYMPWGILVWIKSYTLVGICIQPW